MGREMTQKTSAVLIHLLETAEASLAAARVLLEDNVPPPGGVCKHPSNLVRQVQTFGVLIQLCEACGEFIEADSDDKQ